MGYMYYSIVVNITYYISVFIQYRLYLEGCMELQQQKLNLI
jgi:hypothetical protein